MAAFSRAVSADAVLSFYGRLRLSDWAVNKVMDIIRRAELWRRLTSGVRRFRILECDRKHRIRWSESLYPCCTVHISRCRCVFTGVGVLMRKDHVTYVDYK